MKNLTFSYVCRGSDPAAIGHLLLSCPRDVSIEAARQRIQRRLVLGKMLRNDIGLPALGGLENEWYEFSGLAVQRGHEPAALSLAELVQRLKIAEPFWKSDLLVQEILSLLEKALERHPRELARAASLLEESGFLREARPLAVGLATAWLRACPQDFPAHVPLEMLWGNALPVQALALPLA